MMKIIFFGTPVFAAKTLEYLLEQGISIAAVVSKPDRPKGRSGTPVNTPVKSVIQERFPLIPIYQPEMASSPEFAEVLRQHQADLFVVVAYGEIVKQHLLDMPRLGCINVHASLLPKYRGAAPIQRCIIEGEKESGVSIMYLVKKMDAGDVIKEVSTPIDDQMTAGELEQNLCVIGSKALLEVIRDLEQGKVQRYPQDHAQATHAPKIELEDCEVDWSRSAQDIHNLVRGVNPEPGAWCSIWVRGEKKRLKIYQTRVIENAQGKPGEILIFAKGTPASEWGQSLCIACGKGAIAILELQLEGKKAMSSAELMRGFPSGTLKFIQEDNVSL